MPPLDAQHAPAVAVLGDTPYSTTEAGRLDRLIGDLNARPLAFVVHVGDLGTSAQACRDDWLAARRAQLGRLSHPLIVLPGDNDWSDCHLQGADPLARLARWRELFCVAPASIRVERQPGPYCEHVRWRIGETLFVALNVPGNRNNARQPEEHRRRMEAALAWLEAAARLEPRRLVVLMHANPYLAAKPYRVLMERLQALASRRPGRVVLVHGDTHIAKDDEPSPGLRRIEVWGSPFVGWTRLVLGEALEVESSIAY
ncbi:MAG TPA: hypothetical protein VK043_13005 [Burkholderiales bacterium]|nr:hypothetical protein [Burkholderiales bacterium]